MSLLLILALPLGTDAANPAPELNPETAPKVDVSKKATAQIYSTLPVNCDKNLSKEQGIDAVRLDDNTVLMEVVCGFYAYNAATLHYTQTADEAPKQLQFSLPSFRFHLEKRGDVEHTIIDSVDEMRPTDVLSNTHYDPSTQTLSSYNKHRGVGDQLLTPRLALLDLVLGERALLGGRGGHGDSDEAPQLGLLAVQRLHLDGLAQQRVHLVVAAPLQQRLQEDARLRS